LRLESRVHLPHHTCRPHSHSCRLSCCSLPAPLPTLFPAQCTPPSNLSPASPLSPARLTSIKMESSSSWAAQKKNVVRIFELFRASLSEEARDALAPHPFEELSEEEACNPKMFEEFSHFLVYEYKIESGRFMSQTLAVGPATNYIRILLNLVSDRFKSCGTAETRLSLTALDSYANTEAAVWFKRVKRKMVRTIFQRSMSSGEEMDKSETPLYLEHIKAVCRAYGREGSAEAALRKLAIKCLWQGAGRASEAAWLSWDSLQWDPFFGSVFAEFPQSKMSKYKEIPLVAGADRHSCFFVDFGDFLVLDNKSVHCPDD